MRPVNLAFFATALAALGTGGCEFVWGLDNPAPPPAEGGTGGTMTTTSGSGAQGGGTSCTAGETQACYSGPEGTEGVGVCKAGTQSCDASSSEFGPCMGDVTPSAEDCEKVGDEECDGLACGDTVWVDQFSNVQATTIAADPATGAVYVAGKFSVPTVFGGQMFTPGGGDDIFVIKLDENGKLLWARQVGGPKSEGVVGLAFSNHTVTLLGKTAGELLVDGKAIATGIVTVRFDEAGSVKWVASCAGDVSGRLAIDPLTDDALIAGRFTQIKCGAQEYFSGGDYDLFVSRLGATDGTEVKTQVWQASGEQVTGAITADKDGSLLFGGYSATTFMIGAKSLPAGMFVAKLAANGTYLWANSFGLGDVPGLAADLDGNVVVAANCHGDTNDFGGGPLPLVGVATDVCFAKLNGGDGSQVWARRFGVAGSQSEVGPISPISMDSKGNFALSGMTSGALVIDGRIISTTGFIADFRGDTGAARWVHGFDFSAANLAFSKGDALAAAGTFGPGSSNFGKGAVMTAPGQIDTFVMLISP